jgi:hypothetical protein
MWREVSEWMLGHVFHRRAKSSDGRPGKLANSVSEILQACEKAFQAGFFFEAG